MTIHSDKLEKLLGTRFVEGLSLSMRDWYGPPIPIAGIGSVVVEKGGDFSGKLECQSASLSERMDDYLRQSIRRMRRQARHAMASVGFSGTLDLLNSVFHGRRQQLQIHIQTISGGAGINIHTSWHTLKTSVMSGASINLRNAANAPSGTQYALSDADPILRFQQPQAGEDLYIAGSWLSAGWGSGTPSETIPYLLYDRLWAANVDASILTPVDYSGVPSRYQATSPGWDYSSGNFLFPEFGTVSGTGAHNWTGNYINQDGNAASFPSHQGANNNYVTSKLDVHSSTMYRWFVGLGAGDHGIKSLTQTTVTAALTGTNINWVIGRPVAFLPVYYARMATIINGINSLFRLARIHRDACLDFMELDKPLWNSSVIGHLELVSK